MGTKYTTQTSLESGYNASPPPDDGSTGEDNRITWAKIKTKLTDVLKTFGEGINTAIVDMVDVAPVAKSSTYTTVADDNGRILECTGTFTLTLGAPASMGSGYSVTIKNVSTGTITVSGTIDGASSRTLNTQNSSETYIVDAAGTAYEIASSYGANLNTVVTESIGTGSSKTAALTGTIQRIEVALYNVRLSTTTTPLLRLGTSSSLTATGYVGAGITRYGTNEITVGSQTIGANIAAASSTSANINAIVTCTKVYGNYWTISVSSSNKDSTNEFNFGVTNISLAGACDIVGVVVTSGTFSSGYWSVKTWSS